MIRRGETAVHEPEVRARMSSATSPSTPAISSIASAGIAHHKGPRTQ